MFRFPSKWVLNLKDKEFLDQRLLEFNIFFTEILKILDSFESKYLREFIFEFGVQDI